MREVKQAYVIKLFLKNEQSFSLYQLINSKNLKQKTHWIAVAVKSKLNIYKTVKTKHK